MNLKNKKVLISLIVIVGTLVIGLSGFLYYNISLGAVSSTSVIVNFEVVEGDSINTVITRLDENGVIKNSTMAKLYARINGLHNVKAGKFQLDTAWNTGEVLASLNNATNASQDQVTITFKENFWAKDTANELAKNLDIPAQTFLDLWNDETYLRTLIEKYEFLNEDILQADYRVKLEGYLFPETYSFAKSATPQVITETFLNQFDKVYQEMKADFDASMMSVQEVMTFASMIQYEGKTDEDMGMIAGVFENRLQIDMTLGSSVTICYALYEEHENAEDCETNSDIASPYNTYIHKGLPIGPILNPGKVAIQAALHPTENEYLYFMADIYGDNTVYYAKTLEEHEANVDKYLR